MNEYIATLIIASGFLAIFIIAEILYHQFGLKGETTRKFVHFTAGLYSLIFPVLIDTHWLVLLLGVSFGVILLVSKKTGHLPSIHNVKRKTAGSYIYPLSIYACFLLYSATAQIVLFYLPLLIMAISDTMAAVAGKYWKLKIYGIEETEENTDKTIVGSLSFVVSAFLLSVLLFTVCTQLHVYQVIILSLLISSVGGAAEAVSTNGWDNLSVPLTVGIIALVFLQLVW